MDKVQRSYGITYKEGLGLIIAYKRSRPYIESGVDHTVAVVDNCSSGPHSGQNIGKPTERVHATEVGGMGTGTRRI